MGEEEEWIDKTEEERLGIIRKYDKGREEGAVIEPWDDPAFEVYHLTDHYGFIHDKRFPLKFNPEENKVRDLEAQRADKWIKMRVSWDKYKNSEKLRKRTFKGIPNKVRGLFWGLYLDLPTIQEQQKGKYEEMYRLAREHSLDVRQIDLDVNRTYRDNIMFRERYGIKQRSLFNILCAYSIYNSEVGYCQGMSQVAALLLTYMDEEEAFWGLSQLMSDHKYGMHGFFIAGFPKLVRFQRHHDKILKSMLPKLKKHFDKHGVDVGLYTLKWFFQCFLDRVPFELALRLWDVFLMDGDRVLTCTAFTILKIYQKQLLAKKNMDDLLDYLQTAIPSDLTMDNDKFMQTYQRCMEDLHRKKLDTAGEAGEEELPKKPFGLIENIVKPAPIKREPKVSAIKHVSLPQTKATTETETEDENDDQSERASVSRVTVASAASSSIANSPRNFSRPLSSISNFSYTSAIEEYNSPNKSTPLKMNGISSYSSKPKTTVYVQQQNESMSLVNGSGGGLDDIDYIENGSVKTVESLDFMENQLVINIRKNTDHVEYVKDTRQSWAEDANGVKNHSRPSNFPQPHSATLPLVLDRTHHNHSDNEAATSRSLAKLPFKNRPIPLASSPLWSPTMSPTSVHIPNNSIGGEAVRIHVPYSNSNDISTVPVVAVAGASSSNTRSSLDFDKLKNDPNRIKIDISSK